MQIQINSDNHIHGSEKFSQYAKDIVANKIDRFSDRISRVEVHFSDENGPKKGIADQRCLLEVRIEGRQPMAVSHQAPTLELALDGAAEKLKNTLATSFGRMHDKR